MLFAEEKAKVSRIDGSFVFLETQTSGSCSNCSSKVGCGKVTSVFTLKTKNTLKLSNTLGLKKGDSVIVGMNPDKLLKATILMYLSPLVLLFTFSFFAKLLFGELASILAGFIGLFIGLSLINIYAKQDKAVEQYQPKLIRKIINVNVE